MLSLYEWKGNGNNNFPDVTIALMAALPLVDLINIPVGVSWLCAEYKGYSVLIINTKKCKTLGGFDVTSGIVPYS